MIKKLIPLLLCVPLVAAISIKQKSTCSRVVIKHREKGGVGYDEGYSTGGVFLSPVWRHDFTPFLDLRAHVLNDGRFAFNGGGGVRAEPSDEWAFGLNFFYDYRNAADFNPSQVGIGFEALGDQLDVRLNGYMPVGSDDFFKRHPVEFHGHTAAYKEEAQAALPVIEGEVGAAFTERCSKVFVYSAIGPYYLFQRDVHGFNLGGSWGGRFRLSSTFIKYIQMQVDVTYDKIFHTNVQGMLALHLPLGPRNLGRHKFGEDVLCDKMTQPVIRNEIIPIQDPDRLVPLLHPKTGKPVYFVAPGEVRNANDVVYISENYDGVVTLLPGQIMHGSGLPFVSGEYFLPAQNPGRLPKVKGVVLADGSTVMGFEIETALGPHEGTGTVAYSKVAGVDVSGTPRGRLELINCNVGPVHLQLDAGARYVFVAEKNTLEQIDITCETPFGIGLLSNQIKSFKINAAEPMKVVWENNEIDPPPFGNIEYVAPQSE